MPDVNWKCGNCFFLSGANQCRRTAPSQDASSVWPSMSLTDWCGEFVPKDQATAELLPEPPPVVLPGLIGPKRT